MLKSKVFTGWGIAMHGITPTLPGGNKIDMVKFAKMKEVKDIIKELKAMGIQHNDDLIENGFMAAGMLLKF